MKQCRVCDEWKDEMEFHFRKDSNKYRNECKKCHNKHGNRYYEKNKESFLEYMNMYYKMHKEERKEYYIKNRERIIEQKREYHRTHKEQEKYYCKTHKEQIKKYHRKYAKNQRENNPKIKLNSCISRLISLSLKNGKGGTHWEQLVEYTLKKLMNHLERQFTPEMNWNNYGTYWWLDHIIPVSVFNFDNYNQLDFKRCWALSNLQPMEKTKNIKKGNKIIGSFQLNFKI